MKDLFERYSKNSKHVEGILDFYEKEQRISKYLDLEDKLSTAAKYMIKQHEEIEKIRSYFNPQITTADKILPYLSKHFEYKDITNFWKTDDNTKISSQFEDYFKENTKAKDILSSINFTNPKLNNYFPNTFYSRAFNDAIRVHQNDIEDYLYLFDDDKISEEAEEKLSELISTIYNFVIEQIAPYLEKLPRITREKITATISFVISCWIIFIALHDKYFLPNNQEVIDQIILQMNKNQKSILINQKKQEYYDKQFSFKTTQQVILRSEAKKSKNNNVTVLDVDYQVKILDKKQKWFKLEFFDLNNGTKKTGWILKKKDGKKTLSPLNP